MGENEFDELPETPDDSEAANVPETPDDSEAANVPEAERVPETTDNLSEAGQVAETKNAIRESATERLFFRTHTETVPPVETRILETAPGQLLAETKFEETRQDILERYGRWMELKQRKDFEAVKARDTIRVQLPELFYAALPDVYPKPLGYFDPNTGLIYILDKEGFIERTTVHEAVHKASHSEIRRPDGTITDKDGLIEWPKEKPFLDVLSKVNEGVTEFFRLQIIRNPGEAVSECKCLRNNAREMADLFGVEALEKAYFDNGMDALRELVQKYDGETENAWETFCRNFVAEAVVAEETRFPNLEAFEQAKKEAAKPFKKQLARIWKNRQRQEVRV